MRIYIHVVKTGKFEGKYHGWNLPPSLACTSYMYTHMVLIFIYDTYTTHESEGCLLQVLENKLPSCLGEVLQNSLL